MRRILLLGFCLGFFGQFILANGFLYNYEQPLKLPCNCSNSIFIRGKLKFDNLLRNFLHDVAEKFNNIVYGHPIVGPRTPGTPEGSDDYNGRDLRDYELIFRMFDLPNTAKNDPIIFSAIPPIPTTPPTPPITTITPRSVTLFPDKVSPADFPRVVQWIKTIEIERIIFILNSLGGNSRVPELIKDWRKDPQVPVLLVFDKTPEPIDPNGSSFEVPIDPDSGAPTDTNDEPLPKIPFEFITYIITHLKTPSNNDDKIGTTIDKLENIVRKVTSLNYFINNGFKIDIVIKFNESPADPYQNPQNYPDSAFPWFELPVPYPDVEPPSIPTILLMLLRKQIRVPDSNKFELIIWRLQEVLKNVKQLNRFINGRLTIKIKFKFIEIPNRKPGPTRIIMDSPYSMSYPPVDVQQSMDIRPNGIIPMAQIPFVLRIVFKKYNYYETSEKDIIIMRRIQDLISRVSHLNILLKSRYKIDLTLKFKTDVIQDPTYRHIFEFRALPDRNRLHLDEVIFNYLEKPPRIPSIILYMFKKIIYLKLSLKVKPGKIIWRIIDIIWRVTKLNMIVRNGLKINFRFNLVSNIDFNQLYPTRIIVEPPGFDSPAQPRVLRFFQNYLQNNIDPGDSDLNEWPTEPIHRNINEKFHPDPDLSNNELEELIKALKGDDDTDDIVGVKLTKNVNTDNPFRRLLHDLANKVRPSDTKRIRLLNLFGSRLGMDIKPPERDNRPFGLLGRVKEKILNWGQPLK